MLEMEFFRIEWVVFRFRVVMCLVEVKVVLVRDSRELMVVLLVDVSCLGFVK